MNQELKTKWITALRSGEYKQGKEWLRHDGSYCCLGVLAEVAGTEYTGQFYKFLNDDGSHDLCSGMIPQIFAKSIGLSRDQAGTVADMNDAGNKTFLEIADYIEANL